MFKIQDTLATKKSFKLLQDNVKATAQSSSIPHLKEVTNLENQLGEDELEDQIGNSASIIIAGSPNSRSRATFAPTIAEGLDEKSSEEDDDEEEEFDEEETKFIERAKAKRTTDPSNVSISERYCVKILLIEKKFINPKK